jgi:hypothetical protein
MVSMIRGNHNVIPPVDRSRDPGSRERTERRRQTKTGDILEISGDAKQLNACKKGEARGAQPVDRLEKGVSRIRAEIQERIRTGFYESEEVLGHVARQILDLFGL